MILYQATISYFCAGFLTQDGIIIEAAPIIYWSIGKPISTLQFWIQKKGGNVKKVNEE